MTHLIVRQPGLSHASVRVAGLLFIGALALIVALSLGSGVRDHVDGPFAGATNGALVHDGFAAGIIKQPQQFPRRI